MGDSDMTEQDNELLSQYLDGELAAPAAQSLRQRLIAEPQLRRALERLRAVDNRVKNAFEAPALEAVPQHVVNMVQNAATRPERSSHHRAGWGFAIAASLLAATGLLMNPDSQQQSGDYMAATATQDSLLSQILEHSASRGEGWDTLDDGRQVRPLLSFASTNGSWCREYLVSDDGATWRGVACRAGNAWTTQVLSAEQASGSSNEYRPAGATSADQVTSFIDAHAADIALSLKEEASVIAGNWQ